MNGGIEQEPRPVQQSLLMRELDARYRIRLMNYFLRRLRNSTDAEDMTQETFLRLVTSDTFRSAEQADAFVFRVANNLLHDRTRREIRQRRAGRTEYDEERVAQVAEDRELGDRTRNIFILFRLEGMKQKEIAELYGMGLSTVEKHIMKAVLHLAKRFKESK
jgi:RNA polymerase sigma factor (sigma-70 family)